MTEAITYQGICEKCGKTVDLVDYPIDPDDAQYFTDYFNTIAHEGPDGQPCAGSDKSPSSIPSLETHWDDDEEILTMGDLDPEDLQELNDADPWP